MIKKPLHNLLETTLNLLDVEEGVIQLEIVDGKLIMIFEQNVDDGRGVITVSNNSPIGPSVSKILGYNMIIAQKGDYVIDYSEHEFGKIEVAIETH